MRTSLLVAAAPVVAAASYALLTGYLLNRVKPLPISVMPWPDTGHAEQSADIGEPVAV